MITSWNSTAVGVLPTSESRKLFNGYRSVCTSNTLPILVGIVLHLLWTHARHEAAPKFQGSGAVDSGARGRSFTKKWSTWDYVNVLKQPTLINHVYFLLFFIFPYRRIFFRVLAIHLFNISQNVGQRSYADVGVGDRTDDRSVLSEYPSTGSSCIATTDFSIDPVWNHAITTTGMSSCSVSSYHIVTIKTIEKCYLSLTSHSGIPPSRSNTNSRSTMKTKRTRDKAQTTRPSSVSPTLTYAAHRPPHRDPSRPALPPRNLPTSTPTSPSTAATKRPSRPAASTYALTSTPLWPRPQHHGTRSPNSTNG